MRASDPPFEGRRPTIRDVAAAAGVSKSLVSLVFAAPEAVSDSRRVRVLAAATDLGFRPNQAARSLAAAHGGFVGILIADLRNPIFGELIDAAQHEFARRETVALVTAAALADPEFPAATTGPGIELFGDLRPKGLLVVGSVPDTSQLQRIVGFRPVVVASALAEGLPEARVVRGDDRQGIQMLVEHLTSLGHRHIGHIGGAGGAVAELRAAAFQTAMARAGLAQHATFAPSDFTEAGGRAAAHVLLSRFPAPTAIVAVNDLAAVGALATARIRGTRVAVTGYDGTYLAALDQIGLTTIDPDNQQIGRQAAVLLLEPEGPAEVLIAPTLIARRSTLAP